jgi:hypothetical protein
MDKGFHSLRRAVGRLVVQLWQRPDRPLGGQLSDAVPPVSSLAGRWPDSESLVAPRMPAVSSSQSKATGKTLSS